MWARMTVTLLLRYVPHNLYFTMRSTYHMSFTGVERLTVGGPDDVWVAVNKVGVEGSLSEGPP